MTEQNKNDWIVSSSQGAEVDVLFHSMPFVERESRDGRLLHVSNHRKIQEERQIAAITSAVKTPVPTQKPSPNLSPAKNMVCSLWFRYPFDCIRSGPRLAGTRTDGKKDKISCAPTSQSANQMPAILSNLQGENFSLHVCLQIAASASGEYRSSRLSASAAKRAS
jgi:hypothetical protein